jgi:hypothetical protein
LSPAVKYTIIGIAAAVAMALLALLFWCCRRRRARRVAREVSVAHKVDYSRYESSPYFPGGKSSASMEYGIAGAKEKQTVYWK